jgi:hypothetical protein
MTHMHPFHVAAADCVGDVVQGVSDHAVPSLDPRRLQGVDDDVRDFAFSHDRPPTVEIRTKNPEI